MSALFDLTHAGSASAVSCPEVPAHLSGNSAQPLDEAQFIHRQPPRRVAGDDRPVIPDRARTAARGLVEALVGVGVDTFFGIPGGPISPVFDAIVTTGGARLVESRHESAAAFAAAGYHRACGKVAAVVVTAGPGITNAVTGIASAYLERAPMLVICGDVPWTRCGGVLTQDSGPSCIGAESMLAHVTRAAVRVSSARSVVGQGMAALRAATDPGRPGPALLIVPIDIARAPDRTAIARAPRAPGAAGPRPAAQGTAPVAAGAASASVAWVDGNTAGDGEASDGVPRRRRAGRITAPLSIPPDPLRAGWAPDSGAVLEACELLAAASRPLVVVGNGCRDHAGAIADLVDALDVPFVTTPRAKGVISELHPRSLRHGGVAGSMWARRYTGAGVDVALVLGTDLDDSSIGLTPYVGAGGRLIHVDLDPGVFDRGLPTHLGVVAEVGAFVRAAKGEVARRGLRNDHAHRLLRAIRAGSPFAIPGFARDDAEVIAPHRAIADLQAAAPTARFVTDIGGHMLFALHYLTARAPDDFYIALGLGSMGSGIGGALGLAVGDPGRPVVCVCGDGGMQMVGMELLTAAKLGLPIVYAVFNDARYNIVYHGMRELFGCAAGWDTPMVDFTAWAGAMGVPGLRIERPGELTPEVFAALTENRTPAVLDIRIDRDVQLESGRIQALEHMSMMAR